MKFLRNTLITLLILIGVGIAAGLILSASYGKEMKETVISSLNDRLQAKVDVSSVNFSVLRKFPYASVALEQVVMTDRADTLFHFDRVFLQFDLIDLFRGQERIDRVSFENGQLSLRIDEQGDHAYDDIWKGGTSKTESSTAFELDRTEWENVRFHYLDERSNTAFRTWLSYAFLKGRFEEGRSTVTARLDGEWRSFRNGGRTWSQLDRPFSIEIKGHLNNEKKQGSIESGNFAWMDLTGKLSGTFDYGARSRIDLSFETPFQRIKSYLDAWPDLEIPKGYDAEGELRLKGAWKGSAGYGTTPPFNIDLELQAGKIRQKSSGIEAEQLNARGNFHSRNEQGRPMLSLRQFSAKFGGGDWKGNGNWSPGQRHRLDVELKGRSRVEETARFLGIDTIEKAGGKWEASLQLEGAFNTPLGSERELEELSLSGMAKLKDAMLSIKGSPYAFKSLDGTFIFHDQDAGVKKLSGQVAGSGFELKGRSYELLPYLFLPDRKLRLEAELRSDKVDLDQILSQKGKDEASQKEDRAYELQFPDDLQLELDATLDELIFRKFHAKQLEGRFELGPGGINGRDVSMKLAEGEMAGYLALNADSEPYGVRAGAELKQIGIRPFFKAFESFGQKLIRPKHLKGKIDAGIQFSSSLKKGLVLPASSVRSSGDIKIRKGELIGFKPLIELGDQIADQKMLSSFLHLEDLKEKLHHVRFDALQNRIKLRNSSIIIPRFHVRSNALNITASGKHWFDGQIEYRFMILMDKLLTEPKKSEFGYLRDEGRKKRLFVKMTGTTGNPEISFDREAARKYRKEQRQDEKKNVKEVLQKEFGLFEGEDSTESKDKEAEKDKAKFDVKWGSEKDKANEQKQEKGEEKDDKSLWERLGINDEEAEKTKKEKENENE